MTPRRTLAVACVAFLFSAALLRAQIRTPPRVLAADLPACDAAHVGEVIIRDAISATDCSNAGGGSIHALCYCDGSVRAAISAGAGPGGGAPTTADYLVKTADAGLSAERVCTDTATVAWDFSAAGQAKAGVIAGSIGATQVNEASLESILDLADLQGAVTDAQVPNSITVDLATVASALAANGGNCAPGSAAGGVSAAGVAEDCTAYLVGPDDDVPEAGDFGALAATSPITQSGGTISTSIATGRIVGRTTAGAGVMEEIIPNSTLSLSGLALGVVDVTCTGCLGSTEIAGLDAGDTTTGVFSDSQVNGSAEADEVNPTLGTQTQGNYAAGDAEAGAALTGDSATAFFAAGQIEAARGGTGLDTSGSTGVPRISAGTWSANAGLSHLAASTSADLRGVLSDEIGTGAAVFGMVSTMANDLGCTGGQVVRRNAGNTAFECATVASGGGNAVDTTIAVTSDGVYFTTTVTGQAWVTASSVIVCNAFGTTADGLTPETVAVAAPMVTVANRSAGVGFDVLVSSPNGLEGTLRIHCIGV